MKNPAWDDSSLVTYTAGNSRRHKEKVHWGHKAMAQSTATFRGSVVIREQLIGTKRSIVCQVKKKIYIFLFFFNEPINNHFQSNLTSNSHIIHQQFNTELLPHDWVRHLHPSQVEQLRVIKWLSLTLIIFLYLEGQEAYLSVCSILLGAKAPHMDIHHPNTF